MPYTFLSSCQRHATTLSCNAVMVTVLIKAMPVTIDHLAAITIMMKTLALVSWDIALSIPFVHVSAHYADFAITTLTNALKVSIFCTIVCNDLVQ